MTTPMSHMSEQDGYTEIIKDDGVAALIAGGEFTFRVLEAEWDTTGDKPVRVIKRVEVWP